MTSVILYNAGQKHNLKALLPSSSSAGFDVLGTGSRKGLNHSGGGGANGTFMPYSGSEDVPWGLEGEGCGGVSSEAAEQPLPPPEPEPPSAAATPTAASAFDTLTKRAMVRDLDTTHRLAQDLAKFPEPQSGGLRAEANLADGSPCPGSFIRAIEDGIKATRFLADSNKSGCTVVAFIARSTANAFNDVLHKLASRKVKANTKARNFVQGMVSQLGMHCLKHSESREFFWRGEPWRELLTSTAQSTSVALRFSEPTRQQEQNHSPASGTTEEGEVSAGIGDLCPSDGSSWDKASLIPAFGTWEAQEKLSDTAARSQFPPPTFGSVVKVNTSVHRYCPSPPSSGDMFMASYGTPKEVVAVGSYAICAFAVETGNALMSIASEQVHRLSEKDIKLFQFRRGEESGRTIRVNKIKERATSPAALALANSPVSRALVMPHLGGVNTALKNIEKLLPFSKEGLSKAKASYVACQKEAAGKWKLFRWSVIQFLRARHVALCRRGNESTGVAPGNPHEYFFSANKQKKAPQMLMSVREVAFPAAGSGGSMAGAAAAASLEENYKEAPPNSSSPASTSGAASQEQNYKEAPPGSSTLASSSQDDSRYVEFCSALWRNTKSPFEIALPYLLQKINAADGGCSTQYEEHEAIEYLQQMGESGLGVGILKNGKVARN